MTRTPAFAVLNAADAFALLTHHAGEGQPVDARSLWPEQQLLEDGGVIGCLACAQVFNLQRKGGSYQHTCSCAAEGLGAPVEQQGRFMLPLELIGDSQQVLKELSDMLAEAGVLGKVGTPPRAGEDPLGLLRSLINAWTVATSSGEDLDTLTAWSRNPALVFKAALLDPHTYVFDLTREEREEHFRRAVVGIIPARALFSVGLAFWRALSGEETPNPESPVLVKWLHALLGVFKVMPAGVYSPDSWHLNELRVSLQWLSQTFGPDFAEGFLALSDDRRSGPKARARSTVQAALRRARGEEPEPLISSLQSDWRALFPAGARPTRFAADPLLELPLSEEDAALWAQLVDPTPKEEEGESA